MIFTIKKAEIKELTAAFISVFLMGLILSAPAVCATGAKSGLRICAGILVPSLFPFAVPVVFLINTPVYKTSVYRMPVLFLLSLLGGYPIGAKLISELYKNNILKQKTAVKILPFCVNAGPAFIVIAVGKGILGNIYLGYILLISHILSGTLLAVFFARKELFTKSTAPISKSNLPFSDNFSASVNTASSACITLSAFVVFFSVINEYIVFYSKAFLPLKKLLFITEVTRSISNTRNIYFISFLLGFAGISIWMQVYSIAGNIKPKFLKFAAVRLLHGILSTSVTFMLLKVFKVGIKVISNGKSITEKTFYSDYTLGISLLVMALLLLINLNSKNRSRNIIRDVI